MNRQADILADACRFSPIEMAKLLANGFTLTLPLRDVNAFPSDHWARETCRRLDDADLPNMAANVQRLLLEAIRLRSDVGALQRRYEALRDRYARDRRKQNLRRIHR